MFFFFFEIESSFEYWCSSVLFNPYGHFFSPSSLSLFPQNILKCSLSDISGPRSHFTPIKLISFEREKIDQNCFLRRAYFIKFYCFCFSLTYEVVVVVELFERKQFIAASRRKLFQYIFLYHHHLFPLKTSFLSFVRFLLSFQSTFSLSLSLSFVSLSLSLFSLPLSLSLSLSLSSEKLSHLRS